MQCTPRLYVYNGVDCTQNHNRLPLLDKVKISVKSLTSPINMSKAKFCGKLFADHHGQFSLPLNVRLRSAILILHQISVNIVTLCNVFFLLATLQNIAPRKKTLLQVHMNYACGSFAMVRDFNLISCYYFRKGNPILDLKIPIITSPRRNWVYIYINVM